jgi:DNA repair protein RadA/Sms
MAKKTAASYACSACGAPSLRWSGRCTRCGEFGTVSEQASVASAPAGSPTRPAQPVREVTSQRVQRTPTGVAEFDRVIGGGLVPGQVLLVSGEPGAGKSTLLLAVADSLASRTGQVTLYISGEESVEQIALRAGRIGATCDTLLLAAETDVAAVLGHVEAYRGRVGLVVVDSVQTMSAGTVEGRAGGVAQVMEVAQTLTRVAKATGVPVCLVGQVTKESVVAGPRALEHIADATLTLDGDRHTSLRLLRAVKNRFGPADEVACFEQSEGGMVEVPDPSMLFRDQRDTPVAGTCVTVTVEGRRPMLAEVQALASPGNAANPRRGVSGLDNARVAMLVAVTERHTRRRLHDQDLFVATVGGIRLRDPGSDVAVCLAIASAHADLALPADCAAIGEVSLSGDIRRVSMLQQRVAEAVRLGYRTVFVPAGSTLPERTEGARLLPVSSLTQLIHAALG